MFDSTKSKCNIDVCIEQLLSRHKVFNKMLKKMIHANIVRSDCDCVNEGREFRKFYCLNSIENRKTAMKTLIYISRIEFTLNSECFSFFCCVLLFFRIWLFVFCASLCLCKCLWFNRLLRLPLPTLLLYELEPNARSDMEVLVLLSFCFDNAPIQVQPHTNQTTQTYENTKYVKRPLLHIDCGAMKALASQTFVNFRLTTNVGESLSLAGWQSRIYIHKTKLSKAKLHNSFFT